MLLVEDLIFFIFLYLKYIKEKKRAESCSIAAFNLEVGESLRNQVKAKSQEFNVMLQFLVEKLVYICVLLHLLFIITNIRLFLVIIL